MLQRLASEDVQALGQRVNGEETDAVDGKEEGQNGQVIYDHLGLLSTITWAHLGSL